MCESQVCNMNTSALSRSGDTADQSHETTGEQNVF